MKIKSKYIIRKRKRFWFIRAVPKHLKDQFDNAYILENLNTTDLSVAEKRRDELAVVTDRLFRNVEEERGPSLLDEARALAKEYADDESPLHDTFVLEDRIADLEKSQGKEVAKQFFNVVQGRHQIEDFVDDYLASSGISERLKHERRTSVKLFAQWRPGLTLDKVDRRIAGEFVKVKLQGLHPTTANQKIMSLRVYWRFLIERGHVEGPSPWDGMRIRPPRVQPTDQAERAFWDNEIVALLNTPIGGSKGQRLKDVMLISCLSGARLEEICTIRVKDVEMADDGRLWFHITQSKTKAGLRRVPVHSRLVELFERRTEGKKDDEYLIEEITSQNFSRSDPVGKQFRQHRLKCGVDEKVEGKRRALTNFHSWRRTFTSKALRADISPIIVEHVIGHTTGKLSVDVYGTQKAADEQMIRCVEAVKLPPGIEV